MSFADLTLNQLSLPVINDKLVYIAGRIRGLDKVGKLPLSFVDTSTGTATFKDSQFTVVDDVDISKKLVFELSGITTGTKRTVTLPDASGTATLLGNASTGSGAVVLATSPVLTTPNIGVATATSVNKVAITAPSTSATLTIADGKTLTISKTLTLTGTDSTTLTFPTTSATIARTDTDETFAGAVTVTGLLTALGANGSSVQFAHNTQEVTLSTTTTVTDSSLGLVPANSVIVCLAYYITQTISGGAVTKFKLGDATTADRYTSDSSTLTAGTATIGMNQMRGSVTTDAAGPTNTNANLVRVTCDAVPTQGKIRIVVFTISGQPPSS